MGGNTNQDVAAEQSQDTNAAEAQNTMTMEAFLADENNRAAYDAAVAEAVAAAVEKKQAEEDEAKRLETLTPEEKMTEKEKELQAREAKLQMAELRSEAVSFFQNAGMQPQLAECLNYSSKEEYEKSRDAVKTAFEDAVQKAVNERLRGKTIPTAVDGKKAADAEGSASANSLKDLIRANQVKR